MSETNAIEKVELPIITVDDLGPYKAMNINRERMAKLFAADLGPSGISEFKLPRIKTPQSGGENFVLPQPDSKGGEKRVPTFQAIILDVRDIRAYWPNPFDETGGVPPSCRSDDGRTGYGEPGGKCGTDQRPICPFAAFGSDEKGKGQACKHMKQFFLARPGSGNWLPEVLNIPPTALTPYGDYVLSLYGETLLPNWVVTEFRLERAPNSTGNLTFSKIFFRKMATLSEEVVDRFDAYAKELRPIWRHVDLVEVTPAPQIAGPQPEAARQEAARQEDDEAF